MDKTYLESPNNPNQIALATPNTQVVPKTSTFDFNAEVQKSLARSRAKESSTITADNTITSDNISPVNNVTLPNKPTPNYGGIQTDINASLQTASQQRQQAFDTKAQEADKVRQQNIKDILGTIEQIGQSSTLTDKAYTEGGVDTLKIQYDDYTNQLEQEQHALTRKLQEIDKNTQGLFGGAVQQAKNDANRESLAKQADLAILQNSTLRKYDTARSIADRKVELQLEPLKTRLDALKFIYTTNKDTFDTADKRAYENKIKDEERQYNELKDEKDKINEYILNALQGGASATLIQKAQSISNQGGKAQDVLSVLGSYSMSPEKRLDLSIKNLQYKKLKDEISSNNDAGELVKINGTDYIRYKDGTISNPVLPEAKDLGVVITRLEDKIKTLDKLTQGSVGLSTSAGSVRGAPIPFLFKNSINDWRADAINIIQKLTVDELGRVKSDGVTFGQLSNGERQAVGDAATALSAASIKDEEGNPTGKFRMSEQKVIDEFNKIKQGYILDFERRTGVSYEDYVSNPQIINTKKADDLVNSYLESTMYGGYNTN